MIERPPDVLKDRLDPGERLLWWGAPPRGIRFRRADLFLVPFSLVWGGFVIFAGSAAWMNGSAPVIAQLILAVFMVVGVYLIFGRFLQDAWRRAGTCYGVTNERVLIATRSELRSIALRFLPEINVTEARNGTGSISFGTNPGLLAIGHNMAIWSGKPQVPTFEWIADARRVHTLIRHAQSVLMPGRP